MGFPDKVFSLRNGPRPLEHYFLYDDIWKDQRKQYHPGAIMSDQKQTLLAAGGQYNCVNSFPER